MDEWQLRAKQADILIVDLDGTLVESDQANFLAYQAATLHITGETPFQVRPSERVTRQSLSQVLADSSGPLLEDIITRKEQIFPQYLKHTRLNRPLYQLLLSNSNKPLILLSNACQKRAEQVLQHHNLSRLFCELHFLGDSDNKFAALLERFRNKNLLIFENDDEQIEKALAAGAREQDIIRVQMT